MEEDVKPSETPSSEGAAEIAAKPEGAFNELLGGIREGERQKYNTVEDALNSISPAQEHIQNLEAENARLKEEAEKSTSIDKLMAKLEEKTSSQTDQSQDKQVFDDSKLTELMDARLTARDKEQVAKQNVDTVVQAFSSKYGDKASEVYNKVASDAGIDGDTLKMLAEKSPQAVLQLAGLGNEATQSQPAHTQSQHRSESFSGSRDKPSARVSMTGYTTADLVSAWGATKELVN